LHDELEQKKTDARKTLDKLDAAGVDSAVTRAKEASRKVDYNDSERARVTGDGRLAPNYYNPEKETLWKKDEKRHVEEKKARAAGIKSYKTQVKADLKAKAAAAKAAAALETLPGQPNLKKSAYTGQRLEGYGGRKGTLPTDWSKARGKRGYQSDEFFGVKKEIANRERQTRLRKEEEALKEIEADKKRDIDASADMQAEIRQEAKDKLAARIAQVKMEEAKKIADAKWWKTQRTIEAAKKAAILKQAKTDFSEDPRYRMVRTEAERTKDIQKKLMDSRLIDGPGGVQVAPIFVKHAQRMGREHLPLPGKIYDHPKARRATKGGIISKLFEGGTYPTGDARMTPNMQDELSNIAMSDEQRMLSSENIDVLSRDISAKTGVEYSIVKSQLLEGVNRGEITIVDIQRDTNGELRANAVSYDALEDQAREHLGYYTGNESNPVKIIDGVPVEYDPKTNLYYIIDEYEG